MEWFQHFMEGGVLIGEGVFIKNDWKFQVIQQKIQKIFLILILIYNVEFNICFFDMIYKVLSSNKHWINMGWALIREGAFNTGLHVLGWAFIGEGHWIEGIWYIKNIDFDRDYCVLLDRFFWKCFINWYKYHNILTGTARRIRADFGTENSNVAGIQRFFRTDAIDDDDNSFGFKSFRYGKSTSNQVSWMFYPVNSIYSISCKSFPREFLLF